MYRFEHRAPLNVMTYPEPSPTSRTGTPLSQGFVLTLIKTVAAEHCSPETRTAISDVDPDAWYEGQLLESVLNEFEDKDPTLPADIGKNIYYSLRSQFTAMGIATPEDVIRTLPVLWQHVTRGDSGEWRATMLGKHAARVELAQPYNCHFEAGALEGALEAFDALDVSMKHSACMRDGAPACVLNVTWEEESPSAD